ncbi:hypothetical protein ACA910_002139 [Epithemia clementina (nom. ined.)]
MTLTTRMDASSLATTADNSAGMVVPNHSYRAALALNNMATTLMEQGCLVPALQTMGDSLTMMQLAFVPQSASAVDAAATTTATTTRTSKSPEAIVQAATQRYSRTMTKKRKTLKQQQQQQQQQESRSSSTYSFTSSYSLVKATPLDDNNNDTSELRCAVEYGPSHLVVFPIRTSGLVCDERDTHEITKQFGIILYNLGLANLLVSLQEKENNQKNHNNHCHSQPHHQQQQQLQLQKQKQKQKKKHERALKFLRMAKSTFVSLLNDRCETDVENNNDSHINNGPEQESLEDPILLLLAALTLNVMCIIFQSQSLSLSSSSLPSSSSSSFSSSPAEGGEGEQDSVVVYYQQFWEAQQAVSCLCSSVDEMEYWTRQMMPPSIAASAA